MCVNQEITHTWKIKSYLLLSIRCSPLLECTWQPLMRKQSHCQIYWIHKTYPPSPMPFSTAAGNKVDVTRDDSQRRFLAQHSVTTLLFHCFEWLQYCSNIWTLCCVALRIVLCNVTLRTFWRGCQNLWYRSTHSYTNIKMWGHFVLKNWC